MQAGRTRPSPSGRSSVARWEPVLLALFFACWLAALAHQLGLLRLGDTLNLGLYPLFSLAGFLGWLFGNVYLHRRRGVPRSLRRRVIVIYWVGPPGILYLLWSMHPTGLQEAAPLVPLLGFGVSTVFFLVPVTLAGAWSDP